MQKISIGASTSGPVRKNSGGGSGGYNGDGNHAGRPAGCGALQKAETLFLLVVHDERKLCPAWPPGQAKRKVLFCSGTQQMAKAVRC